MVLGEQNRGPPDVGSVLSLFISSSIRFHDSTLLKTRLSRWSDNAAPSLYEHAGIVRARP